MVTFLFSVYTITEAKQYAGLGRAKLGLEPGRFQPGHLTWRALVQRLHCFRDHTSKALKYGTRSQSFHLHTPRTSANGMNHTRLCLPSRSW